MYRCSSCGALNRVPSSKQDGTAACGKCRQALDLSGAPQEVTGEQFERAVASSPVPVLVDVWAPWCGPCKAVAPAVEAVAKRRAGRLVTLKLNSDEHPQASSRLAVQGIPTFVLFHDGRELDRRSGAMPLQMLEAWVESALAGAPEAATPS